MGRTTKLVDGCYSFWQGGLFPLLRKLMPDYLAQTSVPRLPPFTSSSLSSSSTAAPATAGAGSGRGGAGTGQGEAGGGGASAAAAAADASGGDADLATTEEKEEVLQAQGKDPVLQALDDLHRTKVQMCMLLLILCLLA